MIFTSCSTPIKLHLVTNDESTVSIKVCLAHILATAINCKCTVHTVLHRILWINLHSTAQPTHSRKHTQTHPSRRAHGCRQKRRKKTITIHTCVCVAWCDWRPPPTTTTTHHPTRQSNPSRSKLNQHNDFIHNSARRRRVRLRKPFSHPFPFIHDLASFMPGFLALLLRAAQLSWRGGICSTLGAPLPSNSNAV